MNCSPFDLRDYFFGEVNAQERRTVESHLAACADCREELAGLGTTQRALLTLRDEEPPRRIAFVSDKVFEPRWWQTWWQSAPKVGFASAAMLSCAILAHAFWGGPILPPQAVPEAQVQATQVRSTAAKPPAVLDEARIDAEVTKRVQAAVVKAVAESEARQMAKALELVSAKHKQLEQQFKTDVAEYLSWLEKRAGVQTRAARYETGVLR